MTIGERQRDILPRARQALEAAEATKARAMAQRDALARRQSELRPPVQGDDLDAWATALAAHEGEQQALRTMRRALDAQAQGAEIAAQHARQRLHNLDAERRALGQRLAGLEHAVDVWQDVLPDLDSCVAALAALESRLPDRIAQNRLRAALRDPLGLVAQVRQQQAEYEALAGELARYDGDGGAW